MIISCGYTIVIFVLGILGILSRSDRNTSYIQVEASTGNTIGKWNERNKEASKNKFSFAVNGGLYPFFRALHQNQVFWQAVKKYKLKRSVTLAHNKERGS